MRSRCEAKKQRRILPDKGRISSAVRNRPVLAVQRIRERLLLYTATGGNGSI
jgi:hypothetical protein